MPAKTVAKMSKDDVTKAGVSGRAGRPAVRPAGESRRRHYTANEVGDAEDAALSNAVSRAAARANAR